MKAQLAEKAIFEQSQAAAYAYIDSMFERDIVPNPAALADLATFDEPVPDSTGSAEALLNMLSQHGGPATSATTGGRYFGFVNGGAIPAAVAARWMTDVWDQNAALNVMSPVAAKLEAVAEQWLVDLLGLPNQTVAGFVGGTSVATMTGLAAARHALLEKAGWDVEANGLFGAPPIRVIISDQAHSSVFKGIALLGLGRDRVELVPSDDQGRIQVDALPELDSHSLVLLQAGNVNTGSFDDFDAICNLAHAAGAWVHIDGAFGLWAAATAQRAYLTKGIEKADSWSVDGHKTLNTPYDSGVVLCKHPRALTNAMSASGSYLQTGTGRDGMFFSPDMSRRSRGIEMWATIKYLGRAGIAQMIDGMCDRAEQFGEMLPAVGYTLLNEVVFNQTLVRCDTPAQTEQTLANIQASGDIWCGGTVWQGEPAIRISVCSWATTAADVAFAVKVFERMKAV